MATQHFGLENFGAEGRISDKGYKFTNKDRQILDSLLYTLFNHDHRAVGSLDAIPNPTAYPVLTTSTSGGSLPPDTDFYYRISFVDASGNESVASASSYVRTDPKIAAPGVMTLATADSGGTLSGGTYKYALAYYQGTATTRAPNIATILVGTATSTNTVTITLDTLPDGAEGWWIYRKSPGDDEYYRLATVAAGATQYVDDGSVNPDCTKKRPTANTTNSSNSITVAIDAVDLPLTGGVTSWRVYRTSVPEFGSRSLAATVVDTTTEGGTDLVTSWVDTGASLSTGVPLEQTAVPPSVPQLDASGVWSGASSRLPSSLAPLGVRAYNFLIPGTLADATTYNQFYVPHDMNIERIDAFYLNAPTGLSGANYLTLSLTDDSLVDEVQSLYNDAAPNDEVQRVWNNATGGTFTLTYSAQTTGSLNYNATASQVETALELLSNIVDVTVTGSGTAANPWIVTFLDPGSQNIAEMTATDSLTGGSTTITTSLEGSDGGTFTLSDGTDTTSAIAYNASAATIETRLETDITSITDVTVTGTGISSDPWLITFVNPGDQDVDLLTVSDASLNGTSYISEQTRGRGNSQIDLVINQNQQYHFWQSATTDFGEQEAESAPATGGTSVSDTLATNDVATELTAGDATASWTVGSLEAGDYVFKFYVSDATQASNFRCDVVDTNGPTTLATTGTIADFRKAYEPAYELEATLDGTENIRLDVVRTSGTVRADLFQYEVVLPKLYGGQTASASIAVTGTPTTNGDDLQVTVWY